MHDVTYGIELDWVPNTWPRDEVGCNQIKNINLILQDSYHTRTRRLSQFINQLVTFINSVGGLCMCGCSRWRVLRRLPRRQGSALVPSSVEGRTFDGR